VNFLGTTDDEPLILKVNNVSTIRLLGDGNVVSRTATATGSDNLVYAVGSVADNTQRAVLVGGANNQISSAGSTDPFYDGRNSGILGGDGNRVTGSSSTISGGNGNTITAYASSINGGTSNIAGGGGWSFIGGGDKDTVEGYLSAVVGGSDNAVKGDRSVVFGGTRNVVVTEHSAILNGVDNRITGYYSVIAGGGRSTISGGVSLIGGGSDHQISGWNSAIIGGNLNNVGGWRSLIGGGESNVVNGGWSAVIGGARNVVSADVSTIAGGGDNTVSGAFASILGGQFNEVTGLKSLIGGGERNRVVGGFSAAIAGGRNVVEGASSLIAGGEDNSANGTASAIIGGRFNRTNGLGSVVAAGDSSDVIANYSAVIAGGKNSVTGDESFIAGGRNNTVGGSYSLINAGRYNTVSGWYSMIGGGDTNVVSANNSAVIAGGRNTVSGLASVIAGGGNNSVNGRYSVINGGERNSVLGWWSFVGAGDSNTVLSDFSAIIGGARNTASGPVTLIVGGSDNLVTGHTATSVGGIRSVISGTLSTGLGGERLRLQGERSIGFRVDPATPTATPERTFTEGRIAAFDNVDLLLANDQGGATTVLRFAEQFSNGTEYTGFRAPDALAATIVYTLPATQGPAGSFLTNNGTGTLSWTSASSFAWSLTGNAGTTPGVNFLGTTDNQRLEFRVNNNPVLRLNTDTTITGWSATASGAYSINLANGSTLTSGGYGTIIGGADHVLTSIAQSQSAIVGGYNNIVEGQNDGILGGWRNRIVGGNTSMAAIIGGEDNRIRQGVAPTMRHAAIVGGFRNEISEPGSAIAGGFSDTVSATNAFIAAGEFNKVAGANSAIIGGLNNATYVNTPMSAIIAGQDNIIREGPATTTGRSAIVGGRQNEISDGGSAIIGGFSDTVSAKNSMIAGGEYNKVAGTNSAILSGYGNVTGTNTQRSAIIAGQSNSIRQGTTPNTVEAAIVGGRENEISESGAGIVGGFRDTVSAKNAFIGGGEFNKLTGANSAALGGFGLTLGAHSVGTRAFAPASANGRRSFASEPNTAAFVNVNMVIANDEATAPRELRFAEQFANGTNYTGFRAPTALAANVVYTLPAAQGAAGTVLTNNGTGTLSWTSASSIAWSLTGNAGTTSGTNFLGTTDNQRLEFRVNNNPVLRLNTDSTITAWFASASGRYSLNLTEGSTLATAGYGTIIGGTDHVLTSPAHSLSAIVGGYNNIVEGQNDGILGGWRNRIVGVNTSMAAIIGGESNNIRQGVSPIMRHAAIMGGFRNEISESGSAIAGGFSDTVSATNAFIAAGEFNKITGGNSAILGGYGLTLGSYSVGTRAFAPASANGPRSFASQSNTVALVNVDVVIANDEAVAPKELRFSEQFANGTNYTGFKAPTALAADVVYTLPSAQGTAGTVLTNDGAGTLSWKAPSTIRTVNANYTAVADDETILVNAAAGDVTVTLPNAVSGKKYTIKKTNAPPNSVTVLPTAGTIDGAADLDWNQQYQGYTVQWDGTNWWIISRF
jgi:hypothetical protein